MLLCARLYSVENTCAPAFMNRLLTGGLQIHRIRQKSKGNAVSFSVLEHILL
jgi:hypothetical protein